MTLRLLRRFLESEYEVDTAQDVEGALEKAKAHRYDAFVLDINLSEHRTGIEVLREVRGMPEYDEVPVLVCTAYARQDHQALFREAGFADVITKPVTKTGLLERIGQALDGSPA